MRKRTIITIITIFAVATFGGMAALAYVQPANIRSMFRDYAGFINGDARRFKYRNTFSITRIDLKKNRIFALFDVEYLLKMDERKHFIGDMMTNGVSELVLGWPDDDSLFSVERFGSVAPNYRGGRYEYFDRHTVFRERISPFGTFQIPDMVEVELPISMMKARLSDSRHGKLYYYLEAFGFYTDGFIDFHNCFYGYDEECYLAIVDGDRLEYMPYHYLNLNYGESGGHNDAYSGVPQMNTVEPETLRPEPVVGEPEVVEPEPEIESEPEPRLEPEPEPEPEPELITDPEPELIPEPVPEVASVPPREEIVEPKNDEFALELEAVALAAEIKPTGGETAGIVVPSESFLAEAVEMIGVPNTGYKNRKREWEFLVLPLIGAIILGFWWFSPYKYVKKIKKSTKKALTFFLRRDKMVTV